MKTEAEWWLEIAERWHNAAMRGRSWYAEPSIKIRGLCISTVDAGAEMEYHLDQRLALFAPDSHTGYWWPHSVKGAQERAWACCFLATMAEDDE